MKFVISFLFTLSVHASPIHLFFEGDIEEAQIYEEVLKREYHVPKTIISLRKVNQCREQRQEGKLDLCLKNNGDLVVVSVDKEFIQESLKVFRAP